MKPLVTIRRGLGLTPFLLCMGIAATPTHADSLSDLQSKLQLIRETADSICNKIPAGGERESIQGQGDVKAELGGLLKKLTDLGISGNVNLTREEYVGVLQQDLAAALKSNSDCKLVVFTTLQQKLLPTSPAPDTSGVWNLTTDQAEALRIRLVSIFPKLDIFIKCRNTTPDCDRLAYILYDVLQRAGWPVSPPLTSRGGNTFMTGERGIKVISRSLSARYLTDALQDRDVGGLPAEFEAEGSDQHILINIGSRP